MVMFSEQFRQYQFSFLQAIEVIKQIADEKIISEDGRHRFARNPSRFSIEGKVSISNELKQIVGPVQDTIENRDKKISGAQIEQFFNKFAEFASLELASEYLLGKFGVQATADGALLDKENTVASTESAFVLELPKVNSLPKLSDFTSVLSVIRLNDPRFTVLNFKALNLTLTIAQLEQLKTALEANIHVGHVIWPDQGEQIMSPTSVVPPPFAIDPVAGIAAGGPGLASAPVAEVEVERYDALKAEIERKLIDNNKLLHRYHPTDYVLALLSKHVNQDPEAIVAVEDSSGRIAVKFNEAEIAAAKKVAYEAILADWQVIAYYDHRASSGYYAVAYLNKTIGQVVLAHRGIEFRMADLLQDESLLKVGIESVINNNISAAGAVNYCATLELARYAKEAGYTLTTTGHGLGGWYAQLSAFYCYADPLVECSGVKAVAFDSPGIKPMIEQYRSTIQSAATNLSTDNLDITCYLSLPNVINSCNAHLAKEIYTIFPDIDNAITTLASKTQAYVQGYLDTNHPILAADLRRIDSRFSLADLITKTETALQNMPGAEALGVATKIKALKSFIGHSLDLMIQSFDPATGRPKTGSYKRVTDWPVLKISSAAETNATTELIGQAAGAAAGATVTVVSSIPHAGAAAGAITSAVVNTGVNKLLSITVGGKTIASVFNIMSEIVSGRIDITSFIKIYDYFDRSLTLRSGLDPSTTFSLSYESHLRLTEVDDTKHILIERKGVIDWYLLQAAQYDHMNWPELSDLSKTQLQELKRYYSVVQGRHITGQGSRYLIITPEGAAAGLTVYHLRMQMLRIQVIDPSIDSAIERRKQTATIVHQHQHITQQVTIHESQPRTLSSVLAPLVVVSTGTRGERREAMTAGFVGRIQQLEQMDQFFNFANPVHTTSVASKPRKLMLISAFGGTGKTTLAAKYLERAAESGIIVRWISANSIIGHYSDMATELGLTTINLTPDLVRNIVNSRLKTLGSILFVFDNLDQSNSQTAQEYINHLPANVSLIMTSRDPELADVIDSEHIKLEPFTETEAKEYTSHKLRSITKTDMQQLIDNIGTLPLRLQLACAVLNNNKAMRVQQYIDRYKKMQSDGTLHPEMEIVLGELFNKGEEGVLGWKLLQYLAYLDPDFTPIEVFDTMFTTDELSQAIAALESLSLISTTVKTILNEDEELALDKQGFNVHRFIITETKNYAKHTSLHQDLTIAPNMIITKLAAVLDNLFPQITNNPDEKWYRASLYFNIAIALCQEPEKDANMSSLLSKLGFFVAEVGCKYQQAITYQEQALDMMKALYPGVNNHDVAQHLIYVGSAYQRFGDAASTAKALQYFEQALDMMKALYPGVNRYDVAMFLNNVGAAYATLGNTSKGLECYEQALRMREALYPGTNHPDVAMTLKNVGIAYQTLGEVTKGLEYKEQALRMYQALYPGMNHPDVADSLIDVADSLIIVGTAYQDRGNADKAFEYFVQALRMYKEIYQGVNHPDVAKSLNNIGGAYYTLDNASKGLEYYEQALDMYQELYPGVNHPDVASSLGNVGVAYLALGKEKAQEYFKKARHMYQELYPGMNHHNVAKSLNCIGSAYQRFGDASKGLDYGKEALSMYKSLYSGVNHPDVASSLGNVGKAYTTLGDASKGLEYYEQALDMYQELYPGMNHPDVAAYLGIVGNACQKLGKMIKAIECGEKALRMYQALHPEMNHPDVATSLNNVGVAYMTLGDAGKALEHEEQALRMYQALHPGMNHPDVAASLNNAGSAYEMLGDEQALEYQERALHMRQALYPRKNHPDVAKSLDGVGSAYEMLGDEKALDYKKQALEMREALYPGVNHPDVADSLNNVGVAYATLGDADNSEALQYFEKALRMYQALYPGMNHPDVAMTLKNVGIIYEKLGDLQKGLEYQKQALVMRQAIYPKNHPHILEIQQNIEVIRSHIIADPISTVTQDTEIVLLSQAEKGEFLAQQRLASLYDSKKNYKKAVYWYKKTANKEFKQLLEEARLGDVIAQYMVGFMYHNGLGVGKREEKALYWYNKAASSGDLDALCDLGVIYESKLEIQEALKWYQQAAEHGHIDAKERYTKLLNQIHQSTTHCAEEHNDEEPLSSTETAVAEGNDATPTSTIVPENFATELPTNTYIPSEYVTLFRISHAQEQVFKSVLISFEHALNVIKQIANERYRGEVFAHDYSRELTIGMRMLGKRICISAELAEPDGTRPLRITGERVLRFFLNHQDLIRNMTITDFARRFGVDVSSAGEVDRSEEVSEPTSTTTGADSATVDTGASFQQRYASQARGGAISDQGVEESKGSDNISNDAASNPRAQAQGRGR